MILLLLESCQFYFDVSVGISSQGEFYWIYQLYQLYSPSEETVDRYRWVGALIIMCIYGHISSKSLAFTETAKQLTPLFGPKQKQIPRMSEMEVVDQEKEDNQQQQLPDGEGKWGLGQWGWGYYKHQWRNFICASDYQIRIVSGISGRGRQIPQSSSFTANKL